MFAMTLGYASFNRRFMFVRTTVAVAAVLLASGSVFGQTVEGFTEPYRQIDVAAASEAGLITVVNVKEGQTVRKGQILAELDVDVLEATLKVAQQRSKLRGRIEAAKAELALRERRAEKLRELFADGHATQGEFERSNADLAIAKANLLLAEEEQSVFKLECARIKAQIERRRVRSPIDGVVTEVHREIGESVIINDPRVLTLVQLDPLRVRFSMSFTQSMSVREGQKLKLKLTESGQDAIGIVEVINPVMDAKSGTVQVTCVIDNRNGRYRSGQRCVYGDPNDSTNRSVASLP